MAEDARISTKAAWAGVQVDATRVEGAAPVGGVPVLSWVAGVSRQSWMDYALGFVAMRSVPLAGARDVTWTLMLTSKQQIGGEKKG